MNSSMPHIVPDTVEMVSSDVHNTSTTEDDDIAGNSVDDDTMSTDSNVEHEEEHKARAIGQNLQRPGGSQYNMNDMPIAPQVSSFKSRRLQEESLNMTMIYFQASIIARPAQCLILVNHRAP